MKEIVFRPLRRIKKTGKITVASYTQWRKIKTADYGKFKLIINEDYKTFPKGELVYDYNGENLFWRHYTPEEIPTFSWLSPTSVERKPYPKMWKTDFGIYSAKGLDCDGVPTFSHWTSNDIYNSKADMQDFEPLTVEIVNYWFGWFLYKLNNSQLIFAPK